MKRALSRAKKGAGGARPAPRHKIGRKLAKNLTVSRKSPTLAASPGQTIPWAGIYYGSN